MSADRICHDYLERLTEASLTGSPLPEPQNEQEALERRMFEETEALFDDFDADGSGVIDFEELHRLLRKEFSTVDDDDEKESVPVR